MKDLISRSVVLAEVKTWFDSRVLDGSHLLGVLEQIPDEGRALVNQNEALLADLREADYMGCDHCKRYPQKGKCRSDCTDCKRPCICNDCYHNNLWEWRGIQKGVDTA